jgi:hypothetical protein
MKDEEITKDVLTKMTVKWGKNIRKLAEIKIWFDEHDDNIEIHNGAVMLFGERPLEKN